MHIHMHTHGRVKAIECFTQEVAFLHFHIFSCVCNITLLLSNKVAPMLHLCWPKLCFNIISTCAYVRCIHSTAICNVHSQWTGVTLKDK